MVLYKVKSGKNLVNKTNAQTAASSAEKLKHAVARFTDVNVGIAEKGGAI